MIAVCTHEHTSSRPPHERGPAKPGYGTKIVYYKRNPTKMPNNLHCYQCLATAHLPLLIHLGGGGDRSDYSLVLPALGRRRNLGGIPDRGLVPENNRGKSPGWATRRESIFAQKRGLIGRCLCHCANPGPEGGGRVRSSQFLGGLTPQGREVPPHESEICPPIPLSCLLELGRGAPAGQGLGGPRRRAGRQVEMREEGRNWGEPWGIQVGPWGETGRARRRVTQKGDLWEEEGWVS